MAGIERFEDIRAWQAGRRFIASIYRVSGFHQFLSIAKASCGEARSDLYTALDVGYITETVFRELIAEGESVANQIGAFRAALAERHKLR